MNEHFADQTGGYDLKSDHNQKNAQKQNRTLAYGRTQKPIERQITANTEPGQK